MRKQYIFDRVDKCGGCHYSMQPRTEDPCTFCERNIELLESKIKDNFQKREIIIPEMEGIEDDTDMVENNRQHMGDWGIGLKPKEKKKRGLK